MTLLITVTGAVQGVGYRPFVAELARETGICGEVLNRGGLVEICAEGGESQVGAFLNRLRAGGPPGARVLRIEERSVPARGFSDFRIAESERLPPEAQETPVFPPDLPVCVDCLREMRDPANRRYRYPLISCAACGPRFSILDALPYDRANTVMGDFPMCAACAADYRDGRRRHAQTVSCHDCGPQLLFRDGASACERGEALEKGIGLLKSGGILALKGIGGYQFLCSPFCAETVARLRLLKGREQKPFAVLFPSVESVRNACRVDAEEERLLCSEARPIVLLRKETEPFCGGVSGDSRFVGAFLPCTGLHQMLADACGPLVATSGNRSGEPMLFEDEEMLAVDSPLLGGVLYHKRRILTPLDDSVARVFRGGAQVIRRSRGVVPLPVLLAKPAPKPILAAGGDLKGCFCLLKGDRALPSQYFGDLQSERALRNYRAALERMERLFGVTPERVACDLHPGYFSTALAQREAARTPARSPVLIQHHHAHAASVMAEHGLDGCIGVVFDGTGYGTDGTVWGGEFLLCRGASFERRGHLSRVRLLGGDTAARDAARTADCYRFAAGRPAENEHSPIVSAALKNRVNTFESSSMGRLFDAAAAILDIRQKNGYEGECPIALENAAADALEAKKAPAPLRFRLRDGADGIVADQADFAGQLLELAAGGADLGAVALGFHRAVAGMVGEVCKRIRARSGETRVALSGGVFANLLLLEDCCGRLEADGFQVYVNNAVPSNDGGISLGQAWLCARMGEESCATNPH